MLCEISKSYALAIDHDHPLLFLEQIPTDPLQCAEKFLIQSHFNKPLDASRILITKNGNLEIWKFGVSRIAHTRARPATYYSLTERDTRSLLAIKKIDRKIAMGFFALKVLYPGCDKQLRQRRARATTHSIIQRSDFERFIAAEEKQGRRIGYIYSEIPEFQKREHYRGFETIAINTLKLMDREPLLNGRNGDELCEIARKGLDENYRFEMLSYLLDQALDGEIFIHKGENLQGKYHTHFHLFC